MEKLYLLGTFILIGHHNLKEFSYGIIPQYAIVGDIPLKVIAFGMII